MCRGQLSRASVGGSVGYHTTIHRPTVKRVGSHRTYNTGVEKVKKIFGTCGRPQQGYLATPAPADSQNKISRSILSFFERISVWHPHHVPAMDDTAGTETPAALTRNVCHAYAAVCRSMPGSRSTLWPGTRQHAPVFSPARRAKGEGALGRGFVKNTFLTLHKQILVFDVSRLH